MNPHVSLAQKEVIGVVSLNSIDFVSQVFSCFRQEKTVAFLSDKSDRYKIQVTGATEILTPEEKFG